MPDHGRRALHRVCDSVSGVNWRPTRFVDELMLTRYACCVCHVIPKTTVLLPCFHALCEECQAGCVVEGGESVCPLDGEPFSEDECETCHLPAKKKRDLKAHCWNEVHGCDFVGPLEALLRHFETACAFHSFPCQRCGEEVPNTKLAAHYFGGCSSALSSAAEAKSSGQGGVLVTTGDVTAAGRKSGKDVRYTCEDEVTVLQSLVNELAEAARMQNATLAASLEALNANVALATDKLSEMIGEHSQIQQSVLAWKAGVSCLSRQGGVTDTASSSDGSTLSRRGTDTLRNLEHLAGDVLMCLRILLQVTKKDYSQSIIQLFLLPRKIDEPTEECVCSSNRVKVNEVVYHALVPYHFRDYDCSTVVPRLHRRGVWFSVAVKPNEYTEEGCKDLMKITWSGKQENNGKFPEVIRVSYLRSGGSVDLRKMAGFDEKWQQVYKWENWYDDDSVECYTFEIAIRD